MQTTLPNPASSPSPSPSYNRAEALARVRKERLQSGLIDLGLTLVTILLALLIGFVVMLIVGKDPVKAYEALLTGPLSRINRTGRWLEDATTLIILGLSVSIPFKARQFSLGAEGQLYLGALVSAVVAIFVPLPPVLAIVIPMACGILAGFLLGIIPGALKAYLNANEIVSTLMINAIVIRAYEFLLVNVLMPEGSQTVRSADIQPFSMWARWGDMLNLSLGRFNIGIIFALLAVVIVWLILQRTPFGYEVRTIGANEKFARYGGINTKKAIMLAFALGGGIAAVGGAHLAMGVHQKLIPGISFGLAFEGIVVALLARNNPLLIPITGLFYSYLRVGGEIMEQQASVGSEIVQVIQAVIILLITAQVLSDFVKRRRAQRAS
jgi:simple sugar transport system permease protein